MNKNIAKDIFTKLSYTITNPTTELIFHNNYCLLVAVVLSAQSTDKAVNKATESLFKIADTPEKMILLGENKLINYIKSIGLYKTKAKNVIELSKILINKFNGEIPNNFDDLINLPGVGAKTANVILNTAFNQPTIAVDTHVFRVSKRIGLSNKNTTTAVEKDLLKRVPKEFILIAHHLLILHGRYTCKAKKPLCDNCVINKLCKFNNP